MHNTQKELLKRLFAESNQKYSTLTYGFDYDDNIVFHLKQLLSKNLIRKQNDRYFLTELGVRKINEYDPETLEQRSYKTFLVGILGTDGENFILKGHPNAEQNFYNFPSGVPEFGEKIELALQRIFYEQTKLKLEEERFEFISLHFKTVVDDQGIIIFDDAFAIYRVNIFTNEKKTTTLGKNLNWFSKKEIKGLSNKWPEIDLCIYDDRLENIKSYIIESNYIL